MLKVSRFQRHNSATTIAAKTHARIEHVFAGLAQMGGKALRSIGLARSGLHLHWKVAADNLQRLVYLKEAKITAF